MSRQILNLLCTSHMFFAFSSIAYAQLFDGQEPATYPIEKSLPEGATSGPHHLDDPQIPAAGSESPVPVSKLELGPIQENQTPILSFLFRILGTAPQLPVAKSGDATENSGSAHSPIPTPVGRTGDSDLLVNSPESEIDYQSGRQAAPSSLSIQINSGAEVDKEQAFPNITMLGDFTSLQKDVVVKVQEKQVNGTEGVPRACPLCPSCNNLADLGFIFSGGPCLSGQNLWYRSDPSTAICSRWDVDYTVINYGCNPSTANGTRQQIWLLISPTAGYLLHEYIAPFWGSQCSYSHVVVSNIICPYIPVGSYYLAVFADTDNALPECSCASNSVTWSPITVNNVADLIVPSFSFTILPVIGQGYVTMTARVQNTGSATAGSSQTQILLSANADQPTSPLYAIGSSEPYGSISPNGGYIDRAWASRTIPFGIPPGIYYVWVWCDWGGEVPECGGANNYLRSSNSFSFVAPPSAPTSPTATPSTICAGGSSTLSASVPTGVTVDWFTVSCGGVSVPGGASPSVSPSSTMTYYARARNTTTGYTSATCASVVVTVNPRPNMPTSPTATPSTICNGQSSVLSATVGAGVTVDWFTGSCGGTPVPGGATPSVSPTTAMTYYARARNTTTGCTSATCASVVVTVNPRPNTPTSPTATPSAICNGQSSVLSATVGAGVTVDWFTGSCGGTPVPGGAMPSVIPSSTMTYFARARNSTTECNSATCAQVDVTVNANPAATASNNGPVCEGATLHLTGGPNGMASYQWTGPSGFNSFLQSPTVTPAVVGEYCLTVTQGGCSSVLACTTVLVNSNPVASITYVSPVCEGGDLHLFGGPDGMISYAWTGSGGFNSPLQNPIVSPAQAGTYSLTVADVNGCQDTETLNVQLQSVPSVVQASLQDNILHYKGCPVSTITIWFSEDVRDSGGELLNATDFQIDDGSVAITGFSYDSNSQSASLNFGAFLDRTWHTIQVGGNIESVTGCKLVGNTTGGSPGSNHHWIDVGVLRTDFQGDGDVDVFDRTQFLSAWTIQNGQSGADLTADFQCDGDVDVFDRTQFLSAWTINNGNSIGPPSSH